MFKKLTTLIPFVLLTACTNIQPVEKKYSGFLPDYSNLQKVETADGSEALRWYKKDVEKKYTKAMVKPVGFFPAPTPNEQVTVDALNKISAYFTNAIKREVGKEFEIVDKAENNTIYIQIALTGVDTPIEGLGVTDVLPAKLAYVGATAALGERDHVVVVYVEGQVTDAMTGELLGKGVRQGVGENLRNDQEQLNPEKVKAVLDGWAQEIGKLTTNIKPQN